MPRSLQLDPDLVQSRASSKTGSMVSEAVVAWIVAGLFTLAALLLSMVLIRQHQMHFTSPVAQSKIVGILWMVPIYAL